MPPSTTAPQGAAAAEPWPAATLRVSDDVAASGSQAPGRYRFLDAIRGIAALAVLYHHTTLSLSSRSRPWEYHLVLLNLRYLDLGKLAVAVFFMVSGYVIPFSLRGATREGLQHFAISRFFRLYPLYWVAILLQAVSIVCLSSSTPPLRLFLVNLSMLQQFLDVPNALGVFWTLQIELIFYGLCALLFWRGWLRQRRVLIGMSASSTVLALGLAFARWRLGISLPVALLLALALMFIGTLWKRAQLESDLAARTAAGWLVAAFLVLLPFTSWLAYGRDTYWYSYVSCYSLALAVFFSMTTFARTQARWLLLLGDISYGVYLLHEVVLEWYQVVLLPHLPHWPVHIDVLLVALLSIALCTATHYGIEVPMVAFGRKLSRRVRLAHPPPKAELAPLP